MHIIYHICPRILIFYYNVMSIYGNTRGILLTSYFFRRLIGPHRDDTLKGELPNREKDVLCFQFMCLYSMCVSVYSRAKRQIS